MASVTISPPIERVKEWIKKLADNPQMRRRILIRSTLELADRMRVYPEEGAYNREPGIKKYGWYQRQFGPRWRRKDGTLGGKNTSQKLQKSWKTKISVDLFSADVFTNVSYAPYLYDTTRRVKWAKSHGWDSADEIADGYVDRFIKIISDEIDKQIDTRI